MSDRLTQLTGPAKPNPNSDLSPAAQMLLTPQVPIAPAPSNIEALSPMASMLLGPQAAPPVAPPPPPPDPGLVSEFTGGVKSGFRDLLPTAQAVGGLAAKTFGYDEVAKDMFELAKQNSDAIEKELPRTVSFEQAFDNPRNFALFAARALGEQVPVIGATILGGGAGGIIGQLVGRGALTAAEGVAAASKFGAAVGGFATAAGLETGATGQELYGATGQINPAAAFSAGIAKGALESVVPLAFASRFGISAGIAEGILAKVAGVLDKIPSKIGRVAAGAGMGTGVEGATEMLQEAIDVGVRAYVDENYHLNNPDVMMRILESGFTGALVGGVLGGIHGGMGHDGHGPERPVDQLPAGAGTSEEQQPPSPPITPGAPTTTPPPGGEAPPVAGAGPRTDPITKPPSIETPTTETAPGAAPTVVPVQTPIRPASSVTEAEAVGLSGLSDFETQQHAVVADGSAPTEFLSPNEAQIAHANGGGQAYTLPKAALETADLTATLHGIPVSVSEGDVEFVGQNSVLPIAREQAVAHLNAAGKYLEQANAIRLNIPASVSGAFDSENATVDQANTKIAELEQAANTEYGKAIELGARIRPKEGEGFRLATPLDPSIPIPKREVLVTPANFSMNQQTIEAKPLIAALAGPGVTVAAANLPTTTSLSEAMKPSERKFAVDVAKLEAAGGALSSTEQEPWFELFGRGTPDGQTLQAAIDRGDLRVNKPLTPAVLEKIRQKVAALQALTMNSTPALVRKAIVNLVKAGLSITPTSTKDETVILGKKSAILRSIREVPALPNPIYQRPTIKFYGTDTTLIERIEKEGVYSDMTMYNAQRHKAGHVEVLVSPEMAANGVQQETLTYLAKVQKILENLLTEYHLMDQKVVLQVIGDGSTAGSYRGTTGNLNRIGITVGYLRDGMQHELAETLFHEFGHMLVAKKFASMPAELRLKLNNAYQTAMTRAAMGKVKDMAGLFAATRALDAIYPSNMSRNVLALYSSERAGINYKLSMDEYMAEQVARYFTSGIAPLTKLERMLRGTARQLKVLYRSLQTRLGISRAEMRPAPAIREWMAAIKANVTDAGGQLNSMLEQQVTLAERDSWRENTGVLGGESGTPDGEMWEKLDTLTDAVGLPAKQKRELKAGVGRINWLIKWGYTIRQLTVLNPKIKGLRLYNELIDRWALTKAQVQTRADGTIKAWRALKQESQNNLAKFIFEVDKMTYLKPDEKPRLPTNAELLALAKKHQLTTESFQIYQRVRGDLLAFLDKMEEIAKRDIAQTVSNPLIQALRVAEVEKEFANLRARPYFPHSRFGDFTVVVKDKKTSKTLYMEQFATHKEATSAFAHISAAYPDASVRVDKIPEEVKPFRGMPPALLAKMRSLPGITETQKQWIEHLTLEFAPTQSFRKRLMNRKDVAGYSLEAMRSYANYMWHGANYLARVEFQGPMQDAINMVHSEASDIQATDGKDVSKLRGIADFMQNHMDQVLTPAPDWAQLRSLAFTWWLGFSPVSAFINLTQNVMTTYPYLATRFGGDARAVKAMTQATNDVQNIARGKHTKISDAQVRAIQRGAEKGITDESFAAELAAVAEGNNLTALLPGNIAQRALMQFSHYASWMYQTSEKFNRRIAFSAAWRLAMEHPETPMLQELKLQNQLEYQALLSEGFDEREALAYLAARDAVWTTQYQYSNAAKPRFMRGRKGVLFSFMGFVQNSLFFAVHDKARVRFMLMMLLMGGMMGLPGAEDIAALVRFAARRLLGEDVNIEAEVRKFITDLAGDTIAPDLILHGISRVGFGIPHAMDLMGLPAPYFDASASVGLGQVIPGVAELGPPGKSFESSVEKVGEGVAGATYGVGINLMKFLADDELPMNDGKRYERALPRAVKNLARAYRYLDEGRERTRTGATMLKFDASDPDHLAEISMQALGFTPTRMSRTWDRQRMVQESIAMWSTRRQMLLTQFDYAMESGSKTAVADVASAIRRYNNEVAIPGYGIRNGELATSRKNRERGRRLAELQLPSNKREIPLTRDIKKLFPESPGAIEDAEHITTLK